MRCPGALRILRRIAALPTPERFGLRDACPGDAARLVVAFDTLLEFGFVERVVEGCGVWHYRLTAKGVAAVASGAVDFARGYEVTAREEPAAATGESQGLTPRQRQKQRKRWS